MAYLDGIANPKIGPDRISPEAQQWRTLRGAPPNMGPQMPPNAAALRASAPAVPIAPTAPAAPPSALARGAQRVGNIAGKISRAAPAAALAGFGDYQIDDPEVDSSAGGTLRAVREGDFAGAGRSLSKGALETAMDLGSSAAKVASLVAPGAPAAYDRFLRGQFGDQLIGPGGPAGSAAPAAPPGEALSAARPLPPGMAPSMAGAGRGSPDHPLRLDMDPTRMSLGSARDFSRELGAVPRKLPGDLREDVIFETTGPDGRKVYSGKNVKADADFVDGLGRKIDNGGMVNVLDTREGYRQNLLELRRNAAERAAAPVGGVGNLGTSTGLRLNDTVAANKAAGATRDERIAMAELAAKRDMNAANVGAQIYGVDTGAATSRYGTDTQAATLRRGQDMDYAEKIDARMMDLAAKRQMRDLQTGLIKAAGGDMRLAAGMAAAYGISPDSFLSLARFDDERVASGDKAIEAAARSLSVGPDGKVVEGDVARNKVALKKSSDLSRATAAQVNAMEPQLVGRQRILNSLNATRDTGLLQAVGIDDPSPEYSSIPDLRGYSAERVGFIGGVATPNVSKGDYKLTKRGEKPVYLRNQDIDEAALGELRGTYGLRLPGR